MVVAIQIKIKTHGTFTYLKGLSKRTKKVGSKEIKRLAKFGAKKIKEAYIQAGIRKGKGYGRIEGRTLSKFRAGIFIPRYLQQLDSMPPHYVALKRGRKITEWARKHFGTKKITGMSEVYYGPKGGILYQKGRRSAVFVTPHPFIDAGYRKMVNRADITANRIANKIVRG